MFFWWLNPAMWPQHLFSIRESAGWSRNPMSVFIVRKIKGHVLFDVSTSSQSALLCRFFVPCLGKFALRNCYCLFQSEFLDWLLCREKWRSLELGKRKQKEFGTDLALWYALVGGHIVVTIGEKVLIAWWYLWEYCKAVGTVTGWGGDQVTVIEFKGSKCFFPLLLLPKCSKAKRAIEIICWSDRVVPCFLW